jgi:hypothetical protein
MKVFYRPPDDPRNRPGLFEFVVDLKGKPFAAMLSTLLLQEFPNPEYDWIWTIQLRCVGSADVYEMPNDEELDLLNTLSIQLFDTLHKDLDLLFIGTTAHRNNFEMMFLGRKADISTIGGAVYELPERMSDAQDRFLHFKSTEDQDWSQLVGLYKIVKEFAPAE